MALNNITLLGRGPGAPLRYQGRGRFGDMGGDEAVAGSLYLILSSAMGDDPMRPRFGCRVWELVFAADNESLAPLASQYVWDAIGAWEPRVIVYGVTTVPDNAGGYQISLDYATILQNTPQNQVFSFGR